MPKPARIDIHTHAIVSSVSSVPQFLIRMLLVYRRAITKIEPSTVGIIVPAMISGTRVSLANAESYYLVRLTFLGMSILRMSRHGIPSIGRELGSE